MRHALADSAAGFRGGGNLARGPNLGYPQNIKLHGFNPLFWMDPNSLSKKKFLGDFRGPKDMMAPLHGLWGAMAGSPPLDPPVEARETEARASHVSQSTADAGNP